MPSPNRLTPQVVNKVHDDLISCIELDLVPDAIRSTRAYHSFLQIRRYKDDDCVYLFALCKVLIRNDPTVPTLLEEALKNDSHK